MSKPNGNLPTQANNDIYVVEQPPTAVPISTPYVVYANPVLTAESSASTTHYGVAYAAPTQSSNLYYPPVNGTPVPISIADNSVGRCRRCGVDFVRDPRIHNADARFYRCSRCADVRFEDFCIIT